MSDQNTSWSKKQKETARVLFDLAKQRDYDNLMQSVKDFCLEEDGDIWKLKDFLNTKANEFDIKYDYRYSQLPLLFTNLEEEGLLYASELEALGADKFQQIKEISNFRKKLKKLGEEG